MELAVSVWFQACCFKALTLASALVPQIPTKAKLHVIRELWGCLSGHPQSLRASGSQLIMSSSQIRESQDRLGPQLGLGCGHLGQIPLLAFQEKPEYRLCKCPDFKTIPGKSSAICGPVLGCWEDNIPANVSLYTPISPCSSPG